MNPATSAASSATRNTATGRTATHGAEVANIEKYKDTNKYILWFKESAREIGPVELDEGEQGLVPQAPRYTSYEKLSEARTLADVF